MRSMHIPHLGEVVVLAEPWTFTVHEERRNEKLIKQIEPTYRYTWSQRNPKAWSMTFPAGFELKVARIYIRAGARDFDSVTFTCPCNGKNIRFWAKLDDVNNMKLRDSDD